MEASSWLTLAVLVVAVAGLAATIRWVIGSRIPALVRHTRYGDVDQRWLIAIALFVDIAYVATGFAGRAGREFWTAGGFLALAQVVLIGSWLGIVFFMSTRRHRSDRRRQELRHPQ